MAGQRPSTPPDVREAAAAFGLGDPRADVALAARGEMGRIWRVTTALATWALGQPGVTRVEATIRPDHAASQRVAAKAGLRRTERVEQDPDEGLVEVWERTRRDGT